MTRNTWAPWVRTTSIVSLLAVAALAVVLRLKDPLSTNVIAAEDPFTHMALVREHVRTGVLEPLYEAGTLYPHAVLAAVWAFTGADLYSIFRFGPVVLGATGVLGVGALLLRHEGPAAAFVGALALAVMPEHIFRTTMMAPTALDLAILPVFLYALLGLLRGRVAWVGVAAPLAAFLVIAHPWLFAIVAPVGLLLVAFSLLPGGPRAHRVAPVGAAAALVVLGGGLAMSVSVCFEECGLGFDDIRFGGLAMNLDTIGLIVAAACAATAAVLVLARKQVTALQERLSSHRADGLLRFVASGLIAAAIVAVTIPAVQHGMPEHVDLPRMLGWPVLVLAAAGAVLIPFWRSPAAHAGAALAAVTYPFAIHNPFHSPFWPHRTVVFLAIGLAILAGAAAGMATKAAAAAWNARVARSLKAPHGARPMLAGAGLSLALVVTLGGTVYAATPEEYPEGWYRLYPECEFDALRSTGEAAGPNTIIITGTWQAKLVIAAFAGDAKTVWYSQTYYLSEAERDRTTAGLLKDGYEVIVVVDRHMVVADEPMDTSFLGADAYSVRGAYCSGMGITSPRLVTYQAEGVA